MYNLVVALNDISPHTTMRYTMNITPRVGFLTNLFNSRYNVTLVQVRSLVLHLHLPAKLSIMQIHLKYWVTRLLPNIRGEEVAS